MTNTRYTQSLAIIGNLGNLVDAASIIFLFTSGAVNFIAFRQKVKWKWICFTGAIASALAVVANIIEQIEKIPYAIGSLIVIAGCIFVFRPFLLRKAK